MPLDLLPHVEAAEEKYWLPKKWNPRHSMVVLLHLAGCTNPEISDQTGYSYGKVSQILNDERAQVIMAQMMPRMQEAAADVSIRMKLLAGEALDEIVDEMRADPDSKIRQKAAFGILDRAGYSPVRKTQISALETPDDSVVGQVSDRIADTLDALKESDEILYDDSDGDGVFEPEENGEPDGE